MGPIDSPKTSVLRQPTLRNNPEGGRIQFNRGESLRSRKSYITVHYALSAHVVPVDRYDYDRAQQMIVYKEIKHLITAKLRVLA